jgi:hypothetical protein
MPNENRNSAPSIRNQVEVQPPSRGKVFSAMKDSVSLVQDRSSGQTLSEPEHSHSTTFTVIVEWLSKP